MMKSEEKNILDNSIQYIKSVGPKRSASFAKIGLYTIRDLLFYFPTKHLDRTNLLTSTEAYRHIINGYDGELTVIGKIIDKEKLRFNRRELFKIQMKDSSGFFECVWFQGIKYFQQMFERGSTYAISGKPTISRYGNLQFTHPDFDHLTDDESDSFIHTGKIIPFYRIPKELKETNIGDFSLRKIISFAVEKYSSYIEETLPEEVIKKNKLLNLLDSVRNIHFPQNNELLQKAIYRFKYEELFYLEVLVALRKYNYKTKQRGNKLDIKTKLVQNFLKILPFELTKSQLTVLSEIRKDMASAEPMNRLLQGDVGSGKTIVALIAMLIAIDNGFQAVIMAPTEILADQHAKNISSMMHRLNQKFPVTDIKVSLLLGGQKKGVRNEELKKIETGEANIIVGTHALFEEKVIFNNLGLVVIDEQHRFGVAQRGRLISKGNTPDVIVMTATPIPRTLSLTVYGDLDVSVIDEMPKNRIPIKTYLRGESKLSDIYKFIIEKRKEGYQSFIVYPLVEESEKLELKAAETNYEELSKTFFKHLNVGLIHGRMSWQEKEEVMFSFAQKKYDILISTTVIEVGIDIPDANIILINDAHRFGLSQLHQLRGRVGRSNKQAYCILVSKDEFISSSNAHQLNFDYLSQVQLDKYKSTVRMQSMVKYNDGFKIADIDLQLRGPGDMFGTKQSGFPELQHADIRFDAEILYLAKDDAFKIVSNDPKLLSSSYSVIRKNLLTHYSENLKYAKIA